MYRTFRDKHDACIKVVMKPGAPATTVDPFAIETEPPRV
jgi:hypothetical protein